MAVIIGILFVIIFILRLKYLIKFFFSARFWLGLLGQSVYIFITLLLMNASLTWVDEGSSRYYFLIVFFGVTWLFFNFMFYNFRAPVVFLFGLVTLGLVAVGMAGGDSAGGDGGDYGDSGQDFVGGFQPDQTSFAAGSFEQIALAGFETPIFEQSNLSFTPFSAPSELQLLSFSAPVDNTFNWAAFNVFETQSSVPLEIHLDVNDNGMLDTFDADKDLDGIYDKNDVDMDNDGIYDFIDVDMDNDGVHDSVDNDMDNDGVLDGNDAKYTI